MRTMLSLAFVLLTTPAFAQEKAAGSNIDTRIGMGFKVSDAAVRKLLPEGWEISPATSGPNQGANLNVTMVNMQTAYDAEGKPTTPYRGVAFTVPAKKKGTDATVPLVAAGLFTSNYAPGAYGVFLPARITIDHKTGTGLDGKTTVEQTWQLRADGGHSIDIHVQYVAGVPTVSKVEQRVYSAAKPDFFRIYRFEQATEVVRSVPMNVDRVSRVSFKATGDKFGMLFDGSEQLISVTAIPWYSRHVALPAY
ncbi:MAG TPA: hypothetical protein VLI89_01500 [Burkholderiales bacterium]|jgi:hypothetical protein|nr:hypothetical protein [Burkholderiales bacterium]